MRTSGKVLKDFENSRKHYLMKKISHMAFMRDGKCEILYTQKYVDKLEDQLQQKENIIKEVKEYITYWHYRNDFRTNSFTTDVKEELLDILDKKEVN